MRYTPERIEGLRRELDASEHSPTYFAETARATWGPLLSRLAWLEEVASAAEGECDYCRSKPGAPTLCRKCLALRSALAKE
ncbi:MAG TPA: hypothetical protein DCQ64_01195, partial [Candidatus Rokubacteria bacterium]|nr:hypothetical protein [Candidatus Rokubacteria bacterium]